MLVLEMVQYRALRIAIGLMGSTANNCLDVFSGIPLLAKRFALLNFRYLVAGFCRLGHPLREKLGVLEALKIVCCIREYSDVLSLDIVPSKSFTRHGLLALLGTPLVDDIHLWYSLAPRELLTLTSGYGQSCIF
jgi:hypothetical protein